ncbi:MAG: peptidoglycan-binding protein [Leptolyngbyaceae cyanobacterium SL_5_9]|nr:peptidoglycan-binding protein [Leptolyngbyaceae cyanobacterium SL_5_9]NJO75996.1 peptidoglycan-binding protein [Leptolyngbyaceae cyanobacterium RM1_406_9]
MHIPKSAGLLNCQRPNVFLLCLLFFTSILVASSVSPVRAIQGGEESDRTLIPTSPTEGFSEAPILISQSFEGSTLQLGDSGDAVSQLQIRLAELGYYQGSISGIFGPATETAVIQFQQDNGLAADGIVGIATQSALSVTATPSSAIDGVLQLGSSGEAVTQLQTRLAELGYFQGSPTGNFGPATETAVIQFQQANGLIADGVVGRETTNALYGAVSPAPPLVQSAPPVQTFNPVASDNNGILQLGDVGPDVTNLQQRLSNLGYYQGPIDGNFGAGTQSAVTQFQQDNGLVADGIAGPLTLSSIGSVSPRPSDQRPSAQIPSTTGQPSGRFSVLELQRRLQRRGFYSGPLDGELGPGTRQAITAAQRAYGLTADDILNGRFR